MASGNGQANRRKAAKARRVKASLPSPTVEAVNRSLRKTETLNLRLTPTEKEGLRAAASSVGMSISEYMVKCHEVVAEVLKGGR
jgi:hypothetical protein